MTRSASPPARTDTPRQRLLACLGPEARTALELSAAAGLAEKAVLEHLEHLRRSLARQGRRLEVQPAECRACGFSFRKRERLSCPGRCPRCQSTHLRPPRFALPPACAPDPSRR